MKSEQKMKIKYGDFVLLADLLGTTTDNARMRYRRGKEDAVNGIRAIIENREKLQKRFKNQS
ncbi:hypothetical protein [Myroides indicus]|uniref:Uncharacterized protein n=1 Tax=Myroides indicus TaxID=1323422 RepID=A0A4R7FA23_9FLAO|nr:hypothetical protein [Myroides indicus]TDS65304.1 hypothetical protein C8P70_10288 [Myroides indicus]